MLNSFAMPDTREVVSDKITTEEQERLRALLQQALSFDPLEWTMNFPPASPQEDLDKRSWIAAAHRSAVCIYIARVVPVTNPLLDVSSGSAIIDLQALADDVVENISRLQPSDPLFKSSSWPLFLAGAESENHLQRSWIMNALDDLYQVTYWGYICTVKQVLQAIWAFKARQTNPEDCWVDKVKALGSDVLIA